MCVPQQFTLETGARYAAELLHAWVLRGAAESRAAALPTLAGAAPLYRAAPATAVCFSFDDQFDGQISPPRILRNVDWTEVKYETGRSGERKLKPGLASSVHGAVLELDAAVGGTAVQLGYLRTSASHAVAALRCVPPCECAPGEIAVNTNLSTSTTAYSEPHAFRMPRRARGTCRFRIRLTTQGERFKLVGMQVLNGASTLSR